MAGPGRLSPVCFSGIRNRPRVPGIETTSGGFPGVTSSTGEVPDMLLETSEVDFLHHIGARMASGELHEVLDRVVAFVTQLVKCDSCLVYLLEENDLVLRASMNSHPEVVDRLRLPMGKGITGWVAEHREPVAIRRNAFEDPRFQFFNELPEDRFQAFLSVPILCRD